jgi:RNA polymerase sigma factor (sigma-70 family)
MPSFAEESLDVLEGRSASRLQFVEPRALEMLRLVPDMNGHARGRPRSRTGAGAPAGIMSETNAAGASQAVDTHRRARFRGVYDAHYHRVLGYVLRRTATPEDAEDVVAETFLTAWRRLEQLPPGSDTRPWLYGVARRALANHHRGELRRERLTGRIRTDSELPSPHPANPDGEVAWMAAAFARLGNDDRELLALAAWEELDAGQIAVVLGCSRNAARIRLHRARRRLERELRGTGREADAAIAVGHASARSLASAENESGR